MRGVHVMQTVSLAVVMGLAPFGVGQAAAQSAEVIATGLDNPRGLALGPDGAIYVTEAGSGGTSSLCLPQPTGPGERCYGATGAITRVPLAGGTQQRVITGLPSLAGDNGAEATGPHDIQFAFNNAWVTVGSGGDPALLAPFNAQNIRFGALYRISYTGQVTPVVDIAGFETTANPDGGALDSNAYGLRILSDRGVVADAGANALLQINLNGGISPLAVFPARTAEGPGGDVEMDSVPTSVAEGPDGSLYVGELTGFPFPAGEARVYKVPAAGGTREVVADGFTNIIDIAIGPDGSTYVLEHDADGILGPENVGRLTKIGLFGTRTELATGELVAPGALTVGPDNTVYVTTNSSSAGSGEVVRITQGATPSSRR